MKCPKCGEQARVITSHKVENKRHKWRRYECTKCEHRFTTYVIETLRGHDTCEGCAFIDLRYPNASMYPCDRCIRGNPSDYYTNDKINI